jgi:maltose-binding protein MalE
MIYKKEILSIAPNTLESISKIEEENKRKGFQFIFTYLKII